MQIYNIKNSKLKLEKKKTKIFPKMESQVVITSRYIDSSKTAKSKSLQFLAKKINK